MEDREILCPFCHPWQRILKRNEHAFLLLSNPRKVAGHALVIPHRHVERPFDLTSEELLSIFELIYFAEERLLSIGVTGCDIRQNYRPFIKQGRLKVDHVHFHVIPRTLEDRIYKLVERHDTELFEDLSEEEHDRIAAHFH